MKKILLGVGALLLSSMALPAAAHDADDYGYNGYSNGYSRGYDRGYSRDDWDSIRYHVRECRTHARLHAKLNDGDYSYRYGNAAEAHERWHDQHPGAENCGYWLSRYNNWSRYHRGYYGYDRY